MAALFMPLRRFERLMHQHIFKVGWLLTKRLQTTTTLYYTFFLPGVVLHEFVYWFVAGILNVRAERAIAWPEAQQIAELKLNFIRLERTVGRFKLAIISTAPLIVGVLTVWHITNNILNLDEFFTLLRSGQIRNLSDGIDMLLATPDFFLWLYIAFAISNTMMPHVNELRGWRVVLFAIALIGGFFFIVGVGDDVVRGTLAQPLYDGFSLLAGTFAVVIGIDLFVLAVLGGMESIIERITGDSATFQNGKLVTMTREELQKLREAERAKRERRDTKRPALPAGPPSVYSLPFPIPDAPGRETAAEPIMVRREEPSPLPAGSENRPSPSLTTSTSPVRPQSPQATSTEPRAEAPPAEVPGEQEERKVNASVPLAPALQRDDDLDEDDEEDDEDSDIRRETFEELP